MAYVTRNLFEQYKQPENQVTHALFVVLAQNESLTKELLSRHSFANAKSAIELFVQKSPKARQIDDTVPDGYLYVNDLDHCVGVETKIVSNVLSAKQLNGHLSVLKSYKRFDLLVLAPDAEIPSSVSEQLVVPEAVHYLNWHRLVREMIEIGPDQTEVGRYVFYQFIRFLERRHQLTPFLGFRFDEGYEVSLAKHYLAQLTPRLTTEVMAHFPQLKNSRNPNRVSGAYPWQSWYEGDDLTQGVHLTVSLEPEEAKIGVVVPNNAGRTWTALKNALKSEQGVTELEQALGQCIDQTPEQSRAWLGLWQRHYPNRQRAVHDADFEVALDQLLDRGGGKYNPMWWDLLRTIPETRAKYKLNYQLEIDYRVSYEATGMRDSTAEEILKEAIRALKDVFNYMYKLA